MVLKLKPIGRRLLKRTDNYTSAKTAADTLQAEGIAFPPAKTNLFQVVIVSSYMQEKYQSTLK